MLKMMITKMIIMEVISITGMMVILLVSAGHGIVVANSRGESPRLSGRYLPLCSAHPIISCILSFVHGDGDLYTYLDIFVYIVHICAALTQMYHVFPHLTMVMEICV